MHRTLLLHDFSMMPTKLSLNDVDQAVIQFVLMQAAMEQAAMSLHFTVAVLMRMPAQ